MTEGRLARACPAAVPVTAAGAALGAGWPCERYPHDIQSFNTFVLVKGLLLA